MNITKEHLESLVANKKFFLDDTLTICVITLKNNFKIVGTSSVLSDENFNKEIGEKIAYENAFEKIWELEGYRLK